MNTTEISTNETLPWPGGELVVWRITEATFYPVVLTVGIVGSLFVFYVNHFRMSSSTETFFKKTVAGLDFTGLTCFVTVAIYLAYVPESPHYIPCCKFLTFFALTTLSIEGQLLAVIAVDRFMKFCLVRKSGLELSTIKKILAVLVTFNCLRLIPCVLIFTKGEIPEILYGVTITYCFIDFYTDLVGIVTYFIIMDQLIDNTTLLLLLVMYFKIILALRKLSTRLGWPNGQESSAEAARAERMNRATRRSSIVFIAVTAAFVCCYVPFILVVIGESLNLIDVTRLTPGTKVLYDLGKLSPTFNHMLNPLILIFSSNQALQEIKSIFLCRFSFRDFFKRRPNA